MKFWSPEMSTSLNENKTGWCQWTLIFCVGDWMSTWSWPPSPPPACVHLSLTPPCGCHNWMAPYRQCAGSKF